MRSFFPKGNRSFSFKGNSLFFPQGKYVIISRRVIQSSFSKESTFHFFQGKYVPLPLTRICSSSPKNNTFVFPEENAFHFRKKHKFRNPLEKYIPLFLRVRLSLSPRAIRSTYLNGNSLFFPEENSRLSRREKRSTFSKENAFVFSQD